MKTILIVDDAGFMRIALKDILERNGFKVVGEAENGARGVEMYKELRPDIVTMDITMPVMDGIAALAKIKELNSMAIVVMVSAMGQETKIKEAVITGAKGFIIKPFEEENLVKTLNKL